MWARERRLSIGSSSQTGERARAGEVVAIAVRRRPLPARAMSAGEGLCLTDARQVAAPAVLIATELLPGLTLRSEKG